MAVTSTFWEGSISLKLVLTSSIVLVMVLEVCFVFMKALLVSQEHEKLNLLKECAFLMSQDTTTMVNSELESKM